MTNKYEACMIFSVANGEEATLSLKEQFNDLIAKNGTIENVDEWGKRRLAYEINDYKDGFYQIITVKADETATNEFDRLAKITGDIIRHIIVRDEQFEAKENK